MAVRILLRVLRMLRHIRTYVYDVYVRIWLRTLTFNQLIAWCLALNQEEAGGYVYRVYFHEDFPDIRMLMSYKRHINYESSNFLSKLL